MKLSKKRNFIFNKIIKKKNYNLLESFLFLKKYSVFNFIESIDISIKLSNEFLKNNNFIKDNFVFPYNDFKFKRIFVYIYGEELTLIKNIGVLNSGILNFNILNNKNNFNFDLILTNKYYYNYIKFFYKFLYLFKIIITENFIKIIEELDLGKKFFKSDKNGIINISIGKTNYSLKFLFKNFLEFLKFLNKKKPNHLKNSLFSKIYLSSTMGFSFNLYLKNIFFYF